MSQVTAKSKEVLVQLYSETHDLPNPLTVSGTQGTPTKQETESEVKETPTPTQTSVEGEEDINDTLAQLFPAKFAKQKQNLSSEKLIQQQLSSLHQRIGGGHVPYLKSEQLLPQGFLFNDLKQMHQAVTELSSSQMVPFENSLKIPATKRESRLNLQHYNSWTFSSVTQSL